MSMFMRMVATAGVVTCALVTSAHATCGTRGGRDFGRPMEDASAGMISAEPVAATDTTVHRRGHECRC